MKTLETDVIELPEEMPAKAAHATPLEENRRPAPSEEELRAALAAAIAKRRKAEARADATKATARRAEQLHLDARRYLDTFKATHDARVREAREAHAKAISDAIRGEKPVPGTPPAAALDTAALQAAEGQRDALEVSATYLALESQDAAADASKAMQEVQVKAAAVLDHDAKCICAELVACRDVFWKLIKHASGFFSMDERRDGGPRFAKLKDEIATQINPERAMIWEHPEFVEHWKLIHHENGVNAAAEWQWHDYFRRL